MKKFLFFLSISFGLQAQSVTIDPLKIASVQPVVTEDVKMQVIGSEPIIAGQRANGTPAARTSVLNGDRLFAVTGTGYYGSAYSNSAAAIVFAATENWTTSALGTSINFFTTKSEKNEPINFVPENRVTIDHAGNVGIGTTNPQTMVHMQENSGFGSSLGLKTNGREFNFGINGKVTWISNYSDNFGSDPTIFDYYSPGAFLVYSKTFEFKENNSIVGFRLSQTGTLSIGKTLPFLGTRLLVSNESSGVMPTPGIKTIFEKNASNYIGLNTPDANETGIAFGRPALGAFSGGIIYNSANDLNFRTNTNDTRMHIMSGGNVGIGTVPIAKFHVAHGLSGVGSSIISADKTMIVESAASNDFILAGTSTSGLKINFGRPSSNASISTSLNGDIQISMGSLPVQNIASNGNVGVGDFTVTPPAVKLHIDGDFALSKKILLTGGATHIDKARLGASVISVASGGGIEILSGLTEGEDGLLVYLYPIQGTSIRLLNEDTASLAANRIITQSGVSVTISNTGGVTLVYDRSVNRWRVINISN